MEGPNLRTLAGLHWAKAVAPPLAGGCCCYTSVVTDIEYLIYYTQSHLVIAARFYNLSLFSWALQHYMCVATCDTTARLASIGRTTAGSTWVLALCEQALCKLRLIAALRLQHRVPWLRNPSTTAEYNATTNSGDWDSIAPS